MAANSQSQLPPARFVLLLLAAASCLLPTITADACVNSSDIYNQICNPASPCNGVPFFTNCADGNSVTKSQLLINNDFGRQDFGTKYTALGQFITQAQCCNACQADRGCDAFNYISSGGGLGCYFLSNTNCAGHVYAKQNFPAGVFGTGGVYARVNLCPDACSASPAIYDPLCGLSRHLTNCSAKDTDYTTGRLLGTGVSNYGTKFTALGQFITRAECCAACQADASCDAFNYIGSGGGLGCCFLTDAECRNGTYTPRIFPAGSFGTGGSGAQNNPCPGT